MARSARLKKEVERLVSEPPEGVCGWPRSPDSFDIIDASIHGPEGTPYSAGEFKLELTFTDRYPFEPPRARFVTPVYHPNIDSEGRICLDTLKMPPKGSWVPSVSISALLTTIRLLLSSPNPDDGLMPDISRQFQMNPTEFNRTAEEWTLKYACRGGCDGRIPAGSSETLLAVAEPPTPTPLTDVVVKPVPSIDPVATVVASEGPEVVASVGVVLPTAAPPSRRRFALKRKQSDD